MPKAERPMLWARGPVAESPRRRQLDRAIGSGAAASIAFAAMFAITTQLPRVREVLPFTDDLYNALSSVVVVVLAVVLLITGLRALRRWRHPAASGWDVTSAIEARIRLGLALALALVSVCLAADGFALWRMVDAGGSRSIAGVNARQNAALASTPAIDPAILGSILVGLTAIVTLLAWLALLRAWPRRRARTRMADAGAGQGETRAIDTEPDSLDDLLVLGGLHRRPLSRLATLLDRAAWSPRRHRVVTGALLAILAGVAGSSWHAVREGSWATPTSGLLFAALVAGSVLIGYVLAVWPLHALRRAG